MNAYTKTVLYADLEKMTCAVKIHTDLNCYIGGMAQGMAIVLNEKDNFPLSFNIGPLSGAFPFVSKTAAIFLREDKSLGESYGGGRLALVMKMAGLDSIVLLGKSKYPLGLLIKDGEGTFVVLDKKAKLEKFKREGFSGKRSLIEFSNKTLIDSYFSFGDSDLSEIAKNKNIVALMISGTKSYKISNPEYYERIYFDILSKPKDLGVSFMGFKSCGGCPAGCRYSKAGATSVTDAILPRCLVACHYASHIYKDVPRVFSCLESLGYHYNHDDLEQISQVVGKLRAKFN